MASFITLNDQPGSDAGEIAEHCQNLPNPLPVDWVPISNRYVCPIGMSPGRGSILLTKSRLDKLTLRKSLTIRIGDGIGGAREFPGIRSVGPPRCIDPGAADPVFLVNLADRRIDFLQPTVQRYNWRWSPTDPNPAFNTDSFTSLSDVAQDLWNELSGLGSWPGLPAGVPSPTGNVVDQIDLNGFRTADALEDVLAALGCGVAYDPTADTFSICYFPNGEDRALDFLTRNVGSLQYDESPYVPRDQGPIPASVGVVFPVWPADRVAHLPSRVFVVKFDRPGGTWAQGTTFSDSVAYLMDFVPCRVDQRFNPKNQTQLNNRAAQVAQIWYDKFRDTSPQWPLFRTYFSVVDDPDLVPGSSFDLVGWSVGTEGPVTFAARSPLTAATDLYDGPVVEGIKTDWRPVQSQETDGTPMRTGGLPPEVSREQSAWGQGLVGNQMESVRITGAGLGPLYRRGSALRQGEWLSIGTGGKTDQRGRLWRSWEQVGPDDMVRFIKVIGTKDNTRGGRYPCRVMQQVGDPTVWPEEEYAWAREPNGNPLYLNGLYLARATIDVFEGKLTWDTDCCPAADTGYPEMVPICCPLGLPTTLTVNVLGECFPCGYLPVTITYVIAAGRHTGSATCIVASCTYTVTVSLQCYPCANPPLDPDCSDPPCGGADAYFYCFKISITGTGSGCQPNKTVVVSVPASDFDCSATIFTISADDANCKAATQKTPCCPNPLKKLLLATFTTNPPGCAIDGLVVPLILDAIPLVGGAAMICEASGVCAFQAGTVCFVHQWSGYARVAGCNGPGGNIQYMCVSVCCDQNINKFDVCWAGRNATGGLISTFVPITDAVVTTQCDPFAVVYTRQGFGITTPAVAGCCPSGAPGGGFILTITVTEP